MEVIVMYGSNIQEVLKEFKQKAKREIENLTAMNVESLEVVAKSLHVEQDGNKKTQ